jgi:hypothetical protein
VRRAAYKKVWIEVEDLFGANPYRQYNQLDTPESAASELFGEP